jgi:hypothetical protein
LLVNESKQEKKEVRKVAKARRWVFRWCTAASPALPLSNKSFLRMVVISAAMPVTATGGFAMVVVTVTTALALAMVTTPFAFAMVLVGRGRNRLYGLH